MKFFLIGCFSLLLAGCHTDGTVAATKIPPATSQTKLLSHVAMKSKGYPTNLFLAGTTLSFCDQAGRADVDLGSGHVTRSSASCAKQERLSGCDKTPLDIDIRTPNDSTIPASGLGFIDIVDIGAMSYPLKGHARDCAVFGKKVLVASGNDVQLIDAEHELTRTLSEQGGELVALNDRYAAWATFDHIYALRY